MAKRFWVGGAGTWDASSTSNWAASTGGAPGASAPIAIDVAIFDANSGNGYTVTLGSNVTVLVVTANAALNATVDFGTNKITVSGNGGQVFRSGFVAYLGTPVVEFSYAGATGTRTITPGTAAVSSNPPTVKILAGTDIVTLVSGTTGNYKTVDFTGFSGTLSWSSTATNMTVYGDFVISSGMTLPSSTQTGGIVFAGTGGTQQITTATKTFNFPLTFSGAGGTFAFQDALTQNSTRSFTITNGTVQLKNGVTSTVGSFVANNANVKFLQSTTLGAQATLSQASGTVNVADLTIRDINAVGGASWNAYTDFENTDAGNNDGWNFSLSPPYSTAEFPITLRSFTQPRRF